VRLRPLCAIVLLATARAALSVETPPPGGIPDLTGPRALGLSASIGAAAGNDGIFVNPGALAARKRYSAEGGIVLDRRGAQTMDRFVGGSVVDSSQQSSGATLGLSYLRAQDGVYEGNLFHLALAGQVVSGFYLGVTGKWFSVEEAAGPRRTSAATADAGVFWQVAEYVSIGAAGYNLVPIGNEGVAPMGTGVGVALGSDRSFQLTGDWRADFDRGGKTTNRYSGGAEVLLGGLVPLRVGFMRDETLDTRWWSMGAGIVTNTGVAIDFGYRQSFEDPNARTIAASLKLFLFQ
jgi:hypothetical protein